MIVYDSGSKETYSSLDSWQFEVEKNASPSVVKMLLANKSDLETKEVPKEHGEQYAQKNKMMFMETSAKKGFQVTDAFEKMTEKLIELRNMKQVEKETAVNLSVNQTIQSGVDGMKSRIMGCCQ
eukprot:TRINITY_DN12950_c0_g4_i2.p3 TRINITY_DN12950_c0_g4~~TRINITY_DN12950_c0_g4_i2.p3  ORF type:complete len:124 (-),score=49.50 TRINITY_DN12950_c0_g4_i2:151-522(-)